MKLTPSFLRKGLMAAVVAVAGLGLTPITAQAATYPVFTINPAALGGPAVVQEADKLTGPYFENFTLTGGNTFATSGYVLFTTISDENDAPLSPLLTGNQINYQLYATFSATGTYTILPGGAIDFDISTSTAALYADLPGFIPYDTDPTGGYTLPPAELLLGTGTLLQGDGQASSSTNASGNFGITFDPLGMTPAGLSYFVAPVPFYTTINLSGQFINFTLTTNQPVTGSADAVFAAVPEPATLGLLGLGLAGLARMRRRKQQLTQA